MDIKTQKKSIIQLDKVKMSIPRPYFQIGENTLVTGNHVGLQYDINADRLALSWSGKMHANHNDFGSTTIDNYTQIPDIIEKLTDIKIDKDYLLHRAPLHFAHVKIDIFVDEPPASYISLLRELFKRSTDKFDVYKYCDITYQNGLQIIPKPWIKSDLTGLVVMSKTLDNYRFSIYNKGAELRKPDNKEYRQIFDYEFLEKANHILRFEYQLRTFDDMREAFNISEPTLAQIVNSEENPVYNFFMKLLNDAEEGGKYENI